MLSIEWLWRGLSVSLIFAAQFFCAVRTEVEAEKAARRDRHLRSLLGNRKVLSGPFEGMIYGSTQSRCSSHYPKLLGTYEIELAPHLEMLIQRSPAQAVVVGAAEGYYAVGLAKRLPTAEILAFEQSERSRRELTKLSLLNGCRDRVVIKGHCREQDLLQLARLESLLIIDCEGAEGEILSAPVIRHLSRSDFVIETHDGYHPGITEKLRHAFAGSHRVETVEAVHDVDRPARYPLLDQYALSEKEKISLLRESRMHACLRWLVCYSLRT